MHFASAPLDRLERVRGQAVYRFYAVDRRLRDEPDPAKRAALELRSDALLARWGRLAGACNDGAGRAGDDPGYVSERGALIGVGR